MSNLNQAESRSGVQDLGSIIKSGAFLVDVRTPGEFAEGHVKGSVNIPLSMLPFELDKFRNQSNVVVFCLSGGRSAQAKAILEMNGFSDIINGGTWNYVNQFV